MKRGAKRRANGDGCTYYNERRKFWRGYFTSKLHGGKRKWAYAKTEQELAAKLSQLKRDEEDGILDSKRLTVSQFLDKWLESAKPTLRIGTFRLYDGLIDRHIEPIIGGNHLNKLNAIHVQDLYSTLEKNGASPRLREQVHNLLHRAFRQALKMKLNRFNPCDAVEKPKPPKRTMKVLNEAQVGTLVKGLIGDRFGPLIILALKTGLRQGELLALQWEDVDFKSGFLSVRHTLQNDKGSLSLAEPKTPRSRRRIELGQVEISALRRQQEYLMSKGLRSCSWVFPTNTGELLRKDCVLRAFKTRLTNLKLPTIRFHDLRHTAATLMLLHGIHPKVVQERLGHATIAQTMDTYSHILPSMQRDATEKMDEFFASIS